MMGVINKYLQTEWASPQDAADFWMRYWEIPEDKVKASGIHRDYIPQWMN